ncbi:MAG TPA: DUF1501 domain-containing protein [Burkholderiales bacterium]|nr:DUF1501 domain-containing protein [Burkholderiales bacterium]
MDRRNFLRKLGLGGFLVFVPGSLYAASSRYDYGNLLVLIELKGGNDGLNTVIPYADDEYYRLRPDIAIPRDQVLQLDERTGMHFSLKPLIALWQAKELAIIQGVGYPQPNLSHFRSIEIWDTASSSQEYLSEGWLSRVFASDPVPTRFAADGLVIGNQDLGPFSGGGTRAITLANTEQFLRQARLAGDTGLHVTNPALEHILKVENDIQQAASRLKGDYQFKTEFPATPFGNSLKNASQVIAGGGGVAAIKISLNGFDTHSGQPGTQQRLLGELAEGLVAFKSALNEVNCWNSTLIMTYAEFGRRPQQNLSHGTDHGTSNVHFMVGGKVKGGLYGPTPLLKQLDGNGNPAFGVDFRSLYATAVEKWWNLESRNILGGKFATLDVLQA